MKDDAELHCDIKKIIEVIVSLLKNRIKVDDSLDTENAELKAKKTEFETKKVEFLKSIKKCYTDFEGYMRSLQ
uniref:Uncharacterized protein n=1 Tax=Rhizophagus irregularis (strain DAOM 181602 / DAOM 197198 / MUCL 43194) TaxID=747089 RepID=U9TSP5_RHIID